MSPAASMSIDDADRAILVAADGLFYAKGIGAVTMSDVRDRSGVSMRRLYSRFPSKSDLVAAWLNDRHHTWMDWFTSAVEGHSAGGGDRVLATFAALEEWVRSPGYRGCAFVNSVAEAAEIDDRHRAIISAHKRELIAHLAEFAARNHPDGPSWLPAALGVILDGALVQCAVFGDLAPLLAARSATATLLESVTA